MTKKELRKHQKEVLTKFANTKQKKLEDKLLKEKLFKQSKLLSANSVGLTISLPIEVDTSAIISELWKMGKKVYLAKVVPGQRHEMNFVNYDEKTKLIKSSFGVYEVADNFETINNNLDLIIVPALAYDLKNNYRLGFGGGYYDRFLSKHQNIYTISLANSKMAFDKAIWPVDNFDIAIDQIISIEK